MTPEEAKNQQTLWWITSIAISVVCCSVLFILFASYLVEIKNDLRDNDLRINTVEEREDRILSEIQLLRTHGIIMGTAPVAAPAGAVAAPVAGTPLPDSAAPATAPAGTSAPVVAPPALAPADSGLSVTAPVTQPVAPAGAPAAPAK
ncbi:MAG: hypothetical protein P4M15_01080 [Alphaproteobacteria bacterium]|nr:hypothetical protein [Alphaproteobacteria bacterium]